MKEKKGDMKGEQKGEGKEEGCRAMGNGHWAEGKGKKEKYKQRLGTMSPMNNAE